MTTVEERLIGASFHGNVDEVNALLRDNPHVRVNLGHNDMTALHCACRRGHAEVVKVLLAHSAINVNLKTQEGATPLILGCAWGHVSVVCLLLRIPAVLAMADNTGRTPLWWASYEGNHEVIEWLIASGRDLGDVTNAKGSVGVTFYSALEIARMKERRVAELVLESFLANPAQTRQKLRLKLDVNGIPSFSYLLSIFFTLSSFFRPQFNR